MSTIASRKKNLRRAVSGGKGPNFRTVWASLQESDKQHERMKQENYKQLKELKQLMKETDKQIKETNKQLGRLGNRFGETIEYMVMPNLICKFRELGFVFDKAHHQTDIEDREHKIFVEIDITLENGDKVMIVEVKSKPKTEDIIEHIERMEKVRLHGDLHGDKRTFLGAIASMVFNDNVKQFALKNGFYVIEPSGETFIITAPEGEYSPREW